MEKKIAIIKNWIENIADNDDLVSVVSSVCSWNGSLSEYEFFEMDSLNEFWGGCKVPDFLEKLAPNFNVSDDGYIDTIYGLQSISLADASQDIRDNSEEVAEAIAEAMEEDDIYLPTTLENELEELEEE